LFLKPIYFFVLIHCKSAIEYKTKIIQFGDLNQVTARVFD